LDDKSPGKEIFFKNDLNLLLSNTLWTILGKIHHSAQVIFKQNIFHQNSLIFKINKLAIRIFDEDWVEVVPRQG